MFRGCKRCLVMGILFSRRVDPTASKRKIRLPERSVNKMFRVFNSLLLPKTHKMWVNADRTKIRMMWGPRKFCADAGRSLAPRGRQNRDHAPRVRIRFAEEPSGSRRPELLRHESSLSVLPVSTPFDRASGGHQASRRRERSMRRSL